MSGHNPNLRFGMSLREATRFEPVLPNAPALPAIDYALVGKTAPTLVTTPTQLPRASTIVICWADAEWAALQHVFCGGATPMPYSNRSKGSWPGWVKYAQDLPADAPSGWDFWGYYRLVEINGAPVLLWKSNTHLDWPGAGTLAAMIKLLIAQVQPDLILSTGTAGGAKTSDHIGTVRAVSAGTLYESGKPAAQWPDYSNGWVANDDVINNSNFSKLLFAVPVTAADLQAICTKFNAQYKTSYTLAELDPDGLNIGDATPAVFDQTGGAAGLLTTSTFVVGTTSGTYAAYSAIEMDDALIGETCKAANVAFGFIRNISDPVQNAALPAKIQGSWGSAVYDACGFYTSYNGALAAWAMLG
jgi:nucleoside phosphorylase